MQIYFQNKAEKNQDVTEKRVTEEYANLNRKKQILNNVLETNEGVRSMPPQKNI